MDEMKRKTYLRRLILIGLLLLAIFVSGGTLVVIGIPFDDRPFGSAPVCIEKGIWLNYDTSFDDPNIWSWQLVINARQNEPKPWEQLASGSVVKSGISQYSLLEPDLVVIRYASLGSANMWAIIDISAGRANFTLREFSSEAALLQGIQSYGVTSPLQMKNTPTLWRLTVGQVSGVVILVCLGCIIAVGVVLKKESWNVRGFSVINEER